MRALSIKWKLSLALIATGLGLVLSYVVIAKRVFESDKISYVFDSQNSRLSSLKKEIEQRFERTLLISRSVLATYDFSTGKLNVIGEKIFQEEKNLEGLALWNASTGQVVFRREKQSGLFQAESLQKQNLKENELQIKLLPSQKFLVNYKYTQGDTPFLMQVVLEAFDLFPVSETQQSFLLVQNAEVVLSSDANENFKEIFTGLAHDLASDTVDRTLMWKHSSDHYLVSAAHLGLGNFKIIAITPEDVALGALGTLFQRSLIFLAFSTFGLIVVSLTLARGLTLNLGILSQAAEEIGQGNFDKVPTVRSQDEMGLLSSAFTRMSQEIQRLLLETRDKARMEEELKTASLVQERLLPPHSLKHPRGVGNRRPCCDLDRMRWRLVVLFHSRRRSLRCYRRCHGTRNSGGFDHGFCSRRIFSP